MYRRELLGDLVRLAHEIINELLSDAVGDHEARPGVVAVPQTFFAVGRLSREAPQHLIPSKEPECGRLGAFLSVHPHAHCLAARGVWDEKGQWLIAVGTAVAGGPPHRSVRECLPHTAPTLSRA